MNPSAPRATLRAPSNWVLRFDPGAESSLAPLRLLPGLEITRTPEALWLRGTSDPTGSIASPDFGLVANLPASARYECLPDQRLRRLDQTIPTDRLPTTPWLPITAWFQAECPTAAWPAQPPASIPLRLIPSAEEIEPTLLQVELHVFREFVERAPLIRLERLRFAAAEDGQILIHGLPLPPLPGRRFCFHQGVAIPAGLTWSPHVASDVLIRCLAPPPGGVVLWHAEGGVSRIHPEQWLPVTRAAIRATAEDLGLGV